MRLNKLRINGFGKILDKEINFNEKLNIVFGPNESGKSTIQAFIKAMLFGLGKSCKSGISEKERFKPWKTSEYGGLIEYSLDDMRKFCVWRDFNSNQTKVNDSEYKDITNEFDKSKAGGVLFAQEHLGINGVLFENTCFISQLGIRLDSESRLLLSDRITNLVETGNENVSYIQAVKILEKALVEEVGTDRTSERPINKVRERIKHLEKEKASYIKLLERTRVLEEELEELRTEESVQKLKAAAAETVYSAKMSERQSKDMQLPDHKIAELKANLEQKKSEINEISESIPTGSAVFDDDVSDQLVELQSGIEKVGKRFGLLLGIGMGLLIYVLGISIIMKSLIPVNMILGALSLIAFAGSIIYFKLFTAGKSEIRDILAAASVKTISEYSDRKKEIQFLQEKKRILEESVDIICSQLYAVPEKDITAFDSGKNHKDINIQGIPDDILNEIKLLNMTELESYSKENSNKLRKTELKINEVETEIRILSNQVLKLPEIEEQLEGERQEETRLKEFAGYLSRAREILDESSWQLKSNMIPELSDRISDITYNLTGKYNNIKADAGGQGIKVVLEDGNVILPELLSAGTTDQIYFALRAAGVEMLSENGETLPLIIDEPFSQFDDERIKLTVRILGSISEKNQVIIFTCKQNEVDLLTKEASNAQVIRL